MRERYKLVGSVVVLIFMVVLIAACGNNENTSSNSNDGTANGNGSGEVYEENGLSVDEKVTIKVGFQEQGYGRDWYDFAVKKFTERFPNVTFDTTFTPNLGTVLTPLVASGDDKEMYDLFYPSFEGADTFRELAVQGRFETIDDLWERELYDEPGITLRDVTSDSAYQLTSTLHGLEATHNLPSGGYTGGLFYNTALFEEHGWNTNPNTLDEFIELLEEIKADGIIPITYPGQYPDYIRSFSFNMYPWALADAQGKFEEYEKQYQEVELPFYTHELVKEQHQLMYEFGQADYFPEGVAALNHTQSQMQVLRGEAAMVSSGDWIGNEMKDATPEGFTWGFMAIPFTNDPDDEVYVLTGFGTRDMVIWKEKPELVKAWAKEFLLFLYDFEVQMEMAKSSMLPARTDYYDEPARVEVMEEVPRAVADYAAAHNIVQYDPRHTVTMTSPAFGQAKTLVEDATPGITTGGTDPIPVLEQADEFIAKALEEQEE